MPGRRTRVLTAKSSRLAALLSGSGRRAAERGHLDLGFYCHPPDRWYGRSPSTRRPEADAHLAPAAPRLHVRVCRTPSFPLVLRDLLENPRSELQELLLADAPHSAERLEARRPPARRLAKRRVVEDHIRRHAPLGADPGAWSWPSTADCGPLARALPEGRAASEARSGWPKRSQPLPTARAVSFA